MGNLGLTQLAAAQDNKETTVNDITNELDLALSDVFTTLVDNTNARTLTADEWTQAQQFSIENDSPAPTGAIVLTVPDTEKAIFSVFNQTSFTVTIKSTTGTLTAAINPGSIRMLTCDGVDVRAAAGESSAGGSIFIGGFIPPLFRGARVKKLVDLTGQNYSSFTVLTWDEEVYDTDNIHDLVSNTNRVTVPSGVTKVRVVSGIRINNAATDGDFFFSIRDSAASTVGLFAARMTETFSSEGLQVTTGVIDVTGGDWFEAGLQLTGDTSVDIVASVSFLALEIIESSDNADFTAQVVAINGRFNGATAQNAADLTGEDFSAGAVVLWDTDTIDTNGFHDIGSNTERLTVPSGVTKVRLGANVRIDLLDAGEDWSVRIRKNAADFPGGAEAAGMTVGTTVEASIVSPVVDVIAGDFFDVFVDIEADTSVTVDALASAFWIEVVETSGAADVPSSFIAVNPQFFGVIAKTNTAQSLSNATDNRIEFDSIVYDTKFQPNDQGKTQRMFLGADFIFVDGDVSVANDTVTETGHGFTTGEGPIRLTSAGTLPAGLSLATDYWIIVVDVDTFKFALSRSDALADIDVDITAAAGGGDHTVEIETWIVVPADVARVRFTGHASTAGSTGDIVLSLFKNGAIVDGGFQTDMDGTEADKFTANSAVLEVTEGDRFELVVNPAAGTVTLDAATQDTYLAMEIVETAKPLAFPGVTVSTPWLGVVVRHNSNEATVGAVEEVLDWDLEDIDTGFRGVQFHDTSVNNSRLTIPAGVTRVKVGFNLDMGTPSSGTIQAFVGRSGDNGFTSSANNGLPMASVSAFSGSEGLGGTSGVLDVAEGDYFELNILTSITGQVDSSPRSYFWLEVVDTEESAFPPEPIDFYLEATIDLSTPVFKKIATRRFSLHNNFADSQAQADAGPNGGVVVLDVLRNGSSIGSITFADSTGAAQTATFSTAGSVQEDFEIGDRLEVETPADIQSMNEIVVSLWAFRT